MPGAGRAGLGSFGAGSTSLALIVANPVMAFCRECSEYRRLATRRTALFLQPWNGSRLHIDHLMPFLAGGVFAISTKAGTIHPHIGLDNFLGGASALHACNGLLTIACPRINKAPCWYYYRKTEQSHMTSPLWHIPAWAQFLLTPPSGAVANR